MPEDEENWYIILYVNALAFAPPTLSSDSQISHFTWVEVDCWPLFAGPFIFLTHARRSLHANGIALQYKLPQVQNDIILREFHYTLAREWMFLLIDQPSRKVRHSRNSN